MSAEEIAPVFRDQEDWNSLPEVAVKVNVQPSVRPARQDVVAVAREQVLVRGEPLTGTQILQVLQTPDDRLDELLALAHEVRLKWCGPEVEVEGIVSVKTGGCR